MKLLKVLSVAILLTLTTSLVAQELSKSSIEDMIEDMDKAASNSDVVTIAKYIHPDASITMNVTISGKTQVMKASKKQYVQLLTQGLQSATSYDHEISNLDITIKNGKAFASMNVTETIEMNGQTQTGKSQENLTIELIGGRLIITGIVAFTSL